MSDISQLNGFNYNSRDVIQSVIGASFFADYAIVEAVNADKTINVIHASLNVLINGKILPQTKTMNLEVLFPASASFGMKWPIKAGDGVLLIGLRNRVADTTGLQAPSDGPSEFYHYTQNTMKAIPLQSVTAPKVVVEVTDSGSFHINAGYGKIQLKNTAKSLYTILDAILGHVSGLTTIPCVVGSPVTLNPATIAQITQDKADLALLLEA